MTQFCLLPGQKPLSKSGIVEELKKNQEKNIACHLAQFVTIWRNLNIVPYFILIYFDSGKARNINYIFTMFYTNI